MLSDVGSEIDEVKMDHLTFFKVFHSLAGGEERMRFERVVEMDVGVQGVMKTVS